VRCLSSGVPLFPSLLQEALDLGTYTINLNLSHLYDFNPQLYRQLVVYPSDLIPLFDQVLEEERELLANPDNDPEKALELSSSKQLEGRLYGVRSKKGMRSLNPEDMDTLVSIKGMVIRVGGIVPEMQRAFFQCSLCADSKIVPIDEGVINEPVQCTNCQSRHTYSLVHNRCIFSDKQLIKVQETPDSIPEGETPHAIKVFAFNDLVDAVKPGDRVEITGIYKAAASRLNPKRSQLSTIYKTYVDAIHFKKTESTRLANEADLDDKQHNSELPARFDEQDATIAETTALQERIKAMAQEPNIYDRLVRSLAPSIWELEDVKKGILCLLFGGSGAEEGARSGKFRGEINVLMCGDPGTSQ
jgi:DNA replication licensing factor MCM4